MSTPVASVNDIEALELEDVVDYATDNNYHSRQNSHNHAADNNYHSRQNSHNHADDSDSIYGQLADYRQSSIYDELPEGRAKWYIQNYLK